MVSFFFSNYIPYAKKYLRLFFRYYIFLKIVNKKISVKKIVHTRNKKKYIKNSRKYNLQIHKLS